MHLKRTLTILSFVALGASLLSANPPTVGDLKEEQRQIGNAYLGDAVFQIRQSRERLGAGNPRLGQQSGLWALEQLAFAKRRLERHAARIEEARGLFGRATEGTRVDLRKSYAGTRQRYVEVEEQVDTLAIRLKELGYPILARALDKVRASAGGEEAVKAVQEAMRNAGVTERGENFGGGSSSAISDGPISGGSSSGGDSTAGSSSKEITLGDGTRVTVDPAGNVYVNGKKIQGLRYDPATGQFVLANGSSVSPADLKIDPETGLPASSKSGSARGASYSGHVPSGTRLVDRNGNSVTVDGDAPPFQNGKRSFVRKVYRGTANTQLQREVKVNQQLLEAGDKVFKVEESLGESRSWSLSIVLGDTKHGEGKLTSTLRVEDASNNSGLGVSGVTVISDSGQRASVQPASEGAYNVTFTQDGDYTAVAEGKTDWGSVFRIESSFPIALR
jgi:hypothetical protein